MKIQLRLEIIKDQRWILVSLAGNFLLIQVIYQGAIPRCLPINVDFPEGWHLAYSENHWSNEATMLDYFNHVLLPHASEKRKELGLEDTPVICLLSSAAAMLCFFLLHKFLGHFSYMSGPNKNKD